MEGETRLTEGGDEGGWQKEEVDEKKEEDRADAEFTSVLRSCLRLSTIRRLVRSKKSKESEKTVRIGQLSETGAADLCLLYNLDAIKSDISGGAVYRDSTKSASATGRVR
uniref:Uncharacterized protein n=1 Tax=Vespula pensylvanica TaxID=30213 RepID=A0A834N889_VESPE|nr:hypothetical protein H0235_015609 [Vespula pensylvanica]